MSEGQVGFLLDLERCNGCSACEIACRDRHDSSEDTGRLRAQEREGLADDQPYLYHLLFSCFHCACPPCIEACPDGAISKQAATGIVLIDPSRCAGCLLCIESCPFGALHFDPARGVADKCDYCVDDLAIGGPACVLSCPQAALTAAPLANLALRRGVARGVPGFPSSSGVGPAILFLPGDRRLPRNTEPGPQIITVARDPTREVDS